MRYGRRFLLLILIFSLVGLRTVAWGRATDSGIRVVQTNGSRSGVEVTNLVAVSPAKLAPLIPDGYDILPAAAVGLGGQDQGILVIANFRGQMPEVDGRSTGKEEQVAIDIGILVIQPGAAAAAGLDLPGAFHFYTLAIYSDDARYVASLRHADMPAKLVRNITYDREIDDTTGVGQLTVSVPDNRSPLASRNMGLTLPPAMGALNVIFWHNGRHGVAALHFRDEPFQMGNASSQIYALDGSRWGNLLAGSGLGPCEPAPEQGQVCVAAPSLNLRYPQGTVGRLLLLDQRPLPTDRVHFGFASDGASQPQEVGQRR